MNNEKNDWLKEYAQLHSSGYSQNIDNITISPYEESSKITENFPNILPVSMKIAAKTIGLDLVSVKPMEGPPTKPGKSENQQLKEDRMNKLRKIDGKEPNVVLPNDIEVPDVLLRYIDYTYSSGNTQNNI